MENKSVRTAVCKYAIFGNPPCLKHIMHTVLVIDDDAIMLKAYVMILNKGGYSVYSAKNGKEAFERLDERLYDVVLTDMMLPYASGLEIVDRVKSDPRLTHTKVLVASSVGYEDLLKQAVAIGADDYMKKPIMTSDLLGRIKKVLS